VSTGFGSHLEGSDIGALIEVGRRMLPAGEDVDLALIAEAARAPDSLPSGIRRLARFSELADLADAKSVVAVVDHTDPSSIARFGGALRASLAPNALCAVVIAPPRMVAGASGYSMMAPFSEGEIHEVNVPFHESLADDLTVEGRDCSWHIDKSLTGFPALAVLCIGS
jgi:hypothetical protein